MRQNSKVEPSNQPTSAIALHPVLSLALANLDVQLEDELARYRRQRTTAGRTAQPKRKQASHQLDLIAVAATNVRATSERTTSSQDNTADAQLTPALDERLTGIAAPAIAPDAYKPIPAFTANPQPFEAAIALRTPAKPLTEDDSRQQPPLAGDDAHALAHAANPNLDDYLESSEELLRSLADERAEVRAERNFMQSLLTPLGLGSMLLLLLSSAMFGYVIMNPSSLGWLAVKQNGHSNDAPPGQAVLAPPQPDLAKRELPELNLSNLGTLNVGSGIPPKISSVPSSKPAATLNNQPATTTAKAEGSQSSSQPPAPSTQAPMPAATSGSSRPYAARTTAPPQAALIRPAPVKIPVRSVPTAPAPTVSGRGSGGTDSYLYKVGIPFENDQTLENARKVVPDAFVRTLPDGRTIVQLGAARSETEVKANIQGLHNQGLSSAEVYKR